MPILQNRLRYYKKCYRLYWLLCEIQLWYIFTWPLNSMLASHKLNCDTVILTVLYILLWLYINCTLTVTARFKFWFVMYDECRIVLRSSVIIKFDSLYPRCRLFNSRITWITVNFTSKGGFCRLLIPTSYKCQAVEYQHHLCFKMSAAKHESIRFNSLFVISDWIHYRLP